LKIEKKINLALQGGGSHGAFTWGVLDKILEDGRIGIDGICATSAGTMNACVLASGLHNGGPEEARKRLHDFWKKISEVNKKPGPLSGASWKQFLPWEVSEKLSFFMLDSVTRLLSPYQLNPFDVNPLRTVLEEVVDFDELKDCDTKLFISATHVHSGKVEVFSREDLSIDVAMASACLPFLFKAVSINGEDYWDGGYVGNPALFPLFYATDSSDLLVVHINPIERLKTPKTAFGIMDRINEISFNASLLSEMRAVAFVKKLLEHDMLKDEYKSNFKDILIHSVRADDALIDLPMTSKFKTDWAFLEGLRDKGRAAMSAWLDAHFDELGVRDTVDLHQEFLSSTTRIFHDRYGNTRHTEQPNDIPMAAASVDPSGLARE